MANTMLVAKPSNPKAAKPKAPVKAVVAAESVVKPVAPKFWWLVGDDVVQSATRPEGATMKHISGDDWETLPEVKTGYVKKEYAKAEFSGMDLYAQMAKFPGAVQEMTKSGRPKVVVFCADGSVINVMLAKLQPEGETSPP